MEIVCAGYWKTGSKSCSSALRELGYKVADAVETADCFSYIWKDYLDGEITIEEVVKAKDMYFLIMELLKKTSYFKYFLNLPY